MNEASLSSLYDQHNRRSFLRRTGIAAAAVAFAPTAASLLLGKSTAHAASTTDLDVAVLNFALNLEYVEAEFYSHAIYGDSITNHGVDISGTGTQGTVTLKPNFAKVNFSNDLVRQFGVEIATDEIAHVIFVRSVIEKIGAAPIARPNLDLYNSFNALAVAAGTGPGLDPFADDVSFLLGGYIFEDVGVTAYKGGAVFLTRDFVIEGAAGLLAVEAYHSAMLRSALFLLNEQSGNNDIVTAAQKISDLRDSLDGGKDKDQGIANADGTANIVPTNSVGLARARGTRNVLNIAYGAVNASGGGFFPAGFNGDIR